MKKGYKYAVATLVFLVIFTGAFFYKPLKAKITGNEDTEYVYLHAMNIKYCGDFSQAISEFSGKTLETTARFINLDIVSKGDANGLDLGRYIANMSYFLGSDEVPMRCYFDDDAAKTFAALKKGDIVTVKGKFTTTQEQGKYFALKKATVVKVHASKGSIPNILMMKIAAEHGSVEAMNAIGLSYAIGRNGVSINGREAAKWLRMAAELGDAVALNGLGVLYRHGTGVDLSYEKAYKLFSLAADRGFATAMSNLGDMYEQGQYVNRDYAKAREWYQKSLDAGNGKAEEYLKRIIGK